MVIAPWFTWGCCGPGKVTQRTFGTSDQCSPSWTLWFQYTSEPRKKFYSEISIHSFDFLFSKNKEQLEVKTHTHTHKISDFQPKMEMMTSRNPCLRVFSCGFSSLLCVSVSRSPEGYNKHTRTTPHTRLYTCLYFWPVSSWASRAYKWLLLLVKTESETEKMVVKVVG